jgi:hypothetical protein
LISIRSIAKYLAGMMKNDASYLTHGSPIALSDKQDIVKSMQALALKLMHYKSFIMIGFSHELGSCFKGTNAFSLSFLTPWRFFLVCNRHPDSYHNLE